jgi:hypothetical protein
VWQNIAAALQGSDESRLLLELVEHYRQRVSERNEIKLFRKMAIEAEVGEPNLFA